MRHNREEVIQRVVDEFELLDHLVAHLTDEEGQRPVPRPPSQDPWTVKDALAHITHWKAAVARSARKLPVPAEERGLNTTDSNRLVYERWHSRSRREVLAWHRQVQEDVLAALRAAPEEWFSGRERRPDWPGDLVGHSAEHRVKDVEEALRKWRPQIRLGLGGFGSLFLALTPTTSSPAPAPSRVPSAAGSGSSAPGHRAGSGTRHRAWAPRRGPAGCW